MEAVGRDELYGARRASTFQDRPQQQTHGFHIKIEILKFNGDPDIEEFLDWVTE